MFARRIHPDLLFAAAWTIVILMVGTLPLKNFVGHSHWEYIKWLPTAQDLRSPAYLLDIASDLIGNTLLFFPLGYFLSRLLNSSKPVRHMLLAGTVGALLSLSIEFYQVYCHSRFPSVFDVVTNVTGTLLGVLIGRSRTKTAMMERNRALTPTPHNHTLIP